jgi:hypothetical protein
MRFVPAITLATVLLTGLSAAPAAAQPPRPANRGPAAEAPRTVVVRPDANAGQTQGELYQILSQYPPSLGQVLRLDPTLLSNSTYLEPYPALSAFLADHPEIAHNPAFFLGELREYGRQQYDPKMAMINAMQEILAGLALLIGFLTVVSTIAWVLRSVIEHRRWLRVSKTHTETHTKLLDRLTSNEDLMRYMDSPAGRRFLEAAPIPMGAGPRALSAPVGRILWSVQAGCVIAFAGAALVYASGRFASNATFTDLELPLFVMGTTAVAIGTGFVVSSVISYVLSKRLGLLASLKSDVETHLRPIS